MLCRPEGEGLEELHKMGVTVAAKGYKGHQTTVCNPNPIVYSQVHVVLGVLPKTEVICYFKLVFSILLMHT